MTRRHENGYIIETIRVGGSVKVTAIDSATLQEVSVIVPPSTTRDEMTTLAIKKLHYVQKKGSKN